MSRPSLFGDKVFAAISSVSDGNIKYGILDDTEAYDNRRRWLTSLGIDIEDAILVGLKYEGDDYCRYHTVGGEQRGMGMDPHAEPALIADALGTTDPRVVLFLPVADCIGAVLYDPVQRALMLSHLGRHNLEQDGAFRSVEYIRKQFDSQPEHIQVWLSPAASQSAYPLHSRGGRGLHDEATSQLMRAGVRMEHVETSSIDTTTSDAYFSHSRYLAGKTTLPDGRMAVIARIIS